MQILNSIFFPVTMVTLVVPTTCLKSPTANSIDNEERLKVSDENITKNKEKKIGYSNHADNKLNPNKKASEATHISTGQVLTQAQNDILIGFNRAYSTGDFGELDKTVIALQELKAESSQAIYYKAYWLGFALYSKSLALMHNGYRNESAPILTRAIKTLKAINNRDSEVNALLGLASGLNLQFVPRQEIIAAIGETNSYLTASLTDMPTLRSYYANAVSNWNTPVEYGGRTQTESFIRKAMAQPVKTSKLSPTWGLEFTNALYIRVLREKGKNDLAEEIVEQTLKSFPDSAVIKELKTSK